MSWRATAGLCRSGHVDVQSHAHRHALVATLATGARFRESVGAGASAALTFTTMARYASSTSGDNLELGKPALGATIRRATPLLSAQRRAILKMAM